MHRRYALLGIGALGLASCTATDWATIEAQFASVITQVQAGVRSACAQAGVLVPTADSVLQVLISILGSTTVAGVTAAVIKQAIDTIVAVCPAPAPSNAPKAAGSAVINGKTVPINWY
jgi:hypothetical protein